MAAFSRVFASLGQNVVCPRSGALLQFLGYRFLLNHYQKQSAWAQLGKLTDTAIGVYTKNSFTCRDARTATELVYLCRECLQAHWFRSRVNGRGYRYRYGRPNCQRILQPTFPRLWNLSTGHVLRGGCARRRHAARRVFDFRESAARSVQLRASPVLASIDFPASARVRCNDERICSQPRGADAASQCESCCVPIHPNRDLEPTCRLVLFREPSSAPKAATCGATSVVHGARATVRAVRCE